MTIWHNTRGSADQYFVCNGEKAIDMAIEALSKPEPHWIPVTERLPDNSRNVLITHKGGVSMGWYNGLYFEKGASTHHRSMKTVTAWMEFPSPYKGEKNDNI